MAKALTKKAAIIEAEIWIRKHAADYKHERRVLIGSPVDPYSSPHYRHELRVLEGSPAKGYLVVVNQSKSHGKVLASSPNVASPRVWEWQET